MVTYLVYAPISFFFDSVATISLKLLSMGSGDAGEEPYNPKIPIAPI